MKKNKKIITGSLAAAMVLSVTSGPMTALAQENDNTKTLMNNDISENKDSNNKDSNEKVVEENLQEESLKNVGPEIKGLSDKTIKIGESFDKLEGITAIDKEDGDVTSKINVEGEVKADKAGVYELTYSVLDSLGIETNLTRVITVEEEKVENTSAKISGADDIVIELGKSFDLLSGVTATDKEDGNITNSIKVVGAVNTDIEDVYEVTYSVVDSQGLESTLNRNVTVKNLKAEKSLNKIASVKKFNENANDLYHKNIISKDDIKSISNNGNNYASSTLDKAIDGDLNTHWETGKQNTESFKNEVVIELEDSEIIQKIVYGSRRDAFGKGFATDLDIQVSRTSDGDDFESLGNVRYSESVEDIIEINIEPTEVKRIKFVFNEADREWASANEFRLYREGEADLELNSKPEITGIKNEIVRVGQSFDVLEGVTAIDNEDGDLTSKIKVEGSVDTNTPGKYKVTYTVADRFGVETKVVRNVAIEGEKDLKTSKFDKEQSEKANSYNSAFEVKRDEIKGISNNGGNYPGNYLENSIDGDFNTMWETNKLNSDNFTNEVVIELNENTILDRVVYAARSGGKGFAKNLEIQVSKTSDGDDFELVGNAKYGLSVQDNIQIEFEPTEVKRIKFVYRDVHNEWASASEFKLFKPDDVIKSIKNVFTDSLLTEVSEEFNSIEKIDALEKSLEDKLSSYPLKEDIKDYFNIARDAIEGNIVTVKSIEAEQIGNRDKMARENNNCGFGNGDNQPTGLLAKAGDVIEVFVDADVTGPLPELIFSQQEGSWDSWKTNVKLKPGKNVIVVPEIKKTDRYQNEVTDGGPIYIYNPYTKEEQPKTPVIRFGKGAEKFPFLNKDTNEAELKQFLTEYKQKVDEDIRLNPDIKDREVLDVFEFQSEHFIFTGTATAAYEAYVENGVTPSKTLESYDTYAHNIFDLFGLDGSSEIHENSYLRENIRYAQPHGWMYASSDHVGVQKGVLANILVPFEDKGSDWGIHHEIGHRLDTGDKTLTETTNNIISMHMDRIIYKVDSENRIPYEDHVYKNVIKDLGTATSFDEQGYIPRLGSLWQLQMYDNNFWTEFNRLGRELNIDLSGATDKENTVRQNFIMTSSHIIGEDLSEHFERHGFKVDDETKEFLKQYPKSDNKIWYLNEKKEHYIGNGFETEVNVKANSEIKDNKRVINLAINDEVSKDFLGYEIIKNGKVIGFTAKNSFVDETANLNVKEEYQIIPYDLNLNKGKALTIKAEDSIIKGKDIITIELGSEVDLLKGLSALDINGNDITENIIVDDSKVNFNKVGVYPIVYSVIDSENKTVKFESKVVVYDTEDYASDMNYVVKKVGYGEVINDKSPINNDISLLVDGKETAFEKGIGAHAYSELEFDLTDKNYTHFTAKAGLDDYVRNQSVASVKFKVLLDGVLVYDSGVVTSKDDAKQIDIDLKGAKKLTLIADHNGSIHSDHSVWADAKFLNVEKVEELPEENNAPELNVEDMRFEIGKRLDFKKFITATDKEDGDLINNVSFTLPSNFDKDIAGDYEITFSVSDSDGNVTEKTVIVTLYDKEESNSALEKPSNENESDEVFDISKIYLGGEIVEYNGEKYKAKWWTQGEYPNRSSAWEKELKLDENGDVEYYEGMVCTAGMKVSYEGKLYEAKWWTTTKPGSDDSWKAL